MPARTYRASLTPEDISIVRAEDADPGEYDAVVTCTTSALKDVIIAGTPRGSHDEFSVMGDSDAVDHLIAAARM